MKADRDEASPYAAMLAAQDVAERCKVLGITILHIKLRATGGNRFVCPDNLFCEKLYLTVGIMLIFSLFTHQNGWRLSCEVNPVKYSLLLFN